MTDIQIIANHYKMAGPEHSDEHNRFCDNITNSLLAILALAGRLER